MEKLYLFKKKKQVEPEVVIPGWTESLYHLLAQENFNFRAGGIMGW